MIHIVNNPFMCRVGQFTPDKSELVIGIDLNTILSTDFFHFYIGKNRKILYEITREVVLEKGQDWTNPKGKVVKIIPVSLAKTIDQTAS